VETRFRERIKQERERREWSQADLSKRLQAKGLEHIISSTVAKIESGDRAVRIDEANALADLFAVSVDELLGRSPAGTDLVWVASRLLGLARNTAERIGGVSETIADELQDVRYYAAFDPTPPGGSVDELCEATEAALSALSAARQALTALGDVPTPGVTITTDGRSE
jgi:transcriptional regulator with XRE-family HTH domain